MSFFPRLLNFANFQNPLLRTIVPSVAAAVTLQAAVAIPSVAFQTERFYDVSGSLTYLAVGALSLYLPALRAKAVTGEAKLPSILGVFTGGAAGGVWNWRQVVLTGAVTLWAMRLGSYLFQRVLKEGKDSRFDEIKKSPPKFFVAFFAQSMWVSLCIMPVLAINAAPSIALSSTALGSSVLLTDVLGLGLWVTGFLTEVIADRQKSQWVKEKREKQHDEEFLTRGLFGKSRFPNYFGEMTLWTGIATTAAGVLARKPAQLALGLSGGAAGILTTTALSFVSPAFASFLLLKVSGVPLSEKKYDKRYGDRKDYQEWKKNTPRLIPKIW